MKPDSIQGSIDYTNTTMDAAIDVMIRAEDRGPLLPSTRLLTKNAPSPLAGKRKGKIALPKARRVSILK